MAEQPHDIQAEIAVLGAMLLERSAIDETIEVLKSNHFYLDSHRAIFRNICNAYNGGIPVDLVTITEQLKKTAELGKAGGASYITEILDATPSAANVKHHAGIVLDKAIRRELMSASTAALQEASNEGSEIERVLDDVETRIFDIRQTGERRGFALAGDSLRKELEAIEERGRSGKEITGIETGFVDLDRRLLGLHPSELIVIASRPSVGKTSFVLNVAQHVAIKEGFPIGIFSLEMSRPQVIQRLLCSEARVNSQGVRSGRLSAKDWDKIAGASSRISNAPIFIDDSATLSIWELKSKARRLKHSKDIHLLIIDYLQLVSGPKSENRQQEVSAISGALKGLAKTLEIPIIAVSQLSRAVEARANPRPVLSDLRESGAIEQDADVVTMLYRNGEPAELITAKQRNGPTGVDRLTFIPEYARFENLCTEERAREEVAV